MADVFTVVQPLLFVTRFIGLAPFQIDSKKKSFNVFVPALICSAVMLIAFTTNAAFLTYTKLLYKDERIDSYIGLASDVILLACGIVVTVCCILLTIIQRKKYVRVVHDFYRVHGEVAKLEEEIPYRRLHRTSCRYLILLFFILTLLFFHTILYIQNLSTLLYVSYMYAWFVPKIYNFLMEYQFVSGALLLKIHFDTLNKSLGKFDETANAGVDLTRIPDFAAVNECWLDDRETYMSNRFMAQTFSFWEGKLVKSRARKIWCTANALPSPVAPVPVGATVAANAKNLEKIKVIRKIHSNLCEIKEYLNSSFSLQLLTSVAQAFVFITANLYLIFTTLSQFAKMSILTLSYPILWFVTHTVELVIIVLTCTNTSKAANYTAILVHKLLAKECKPELKNQLKLFSIQLLHRKITFTAAGFFNLDMTLLQAIIGAATTYLVILIQFHNTYEVQD